MKIQIRWRKDPLKSGDFVENGECNKNDAIG